MYPDNAAWLSKSASLYSETVLQKQIGYSQVFISRGANTLNYPTDLKDKEWALIQHHFQAKDRLGSASKHSRKQIVDAILYIATTGAQWRLLPNDFPPWKTVYGHFSRWNKSGVWEAALDQLNATYRKKTASTRTPLRDYRLTKHENPV